jgi:heme/copper-type cytochrome/quinol oxidase subunit 2
MDLISILTTVILATTIGTIIVGVAAYAAFKLRDKRKPKKKTAAEGGAPEAEQAVFLKRYLPASADSAANGAINSATKAAH